MFKNLKMDYFCKRGHLMRHLSFGEDEGSNSTLIPLWQSCYSEKIFDIVVSWLQDATCNRKRQVVASHIFID